MSATFNLQLNVHAFSLADFEDYEEHEQYLSEVMEDGISDYAYGELDLLRNAFAYSFLNLKSLPEFACI